MSGKRFTVKPQDEFWAIVDNYNKVCIIDGIHSEIEYEKACIINGIPTKIEAIWLCDFMNEQHSIICKDEISIKTMEFNMKKIEEENEMLKKQLNEMIGLFNESGLDYHISDELEEIL